MAEADLKEITAGVESLSRGIGRFMLEAREQEKEIEIKAFNNLVSWVDRESEKRFVEGLSRILPGAAFIGEEGDYGKSEAEWQWVIDPLDGTSNYLYGIPCWCSSIGLVFKGEPVAGVIYDAVHEECFSAWKGGGAYLNGKAIQCSAQNLLKQSFLATGFPYDDFGRQNEYLDVFRFLLHNSRGIRRLGSAAIDMAYVACGRFDAFYEYGLNAWDVAAGTILIREAGGTVSNFLGEPEVVFSEELIASAPGIHAELLSNLKQFFYPEG